MRPRNMKRWQQWIGSVCGAAVLLITIALPAQASEQYLWAFMIYNVVNGSIDMQSQPIIHAKQTAIGCRYARQDSMPKLPRNMVATECERYRMNGLPKPEGAFSIQEIPETLMLVGYFSFPLKIVSAAEYGVNISTFVSTAECSDARNNFIRRESGYMVSSCGPFRFQRAHLAHHGIASR
jgi:hypothetical protein